MGKRILGVVGSYRKEGVIDTVVSRLLEPLRSQGHEVSKLYLLDYDLKFCSNCRTCMQQPGEARGHCVIEDALERLLDEIERADALILGAPTNLGNVNALTRQFMERCAGFAYWPWGEISPRPRRRSKPTKPALLISSSAAPAPMGRLFYGAMGALKTLSDILGFKPAGTLWVGLVNRQVVSLNPRTKRRIAHLAMRLGRQLR
jgi:hypothetical protein